MERLETQESKDGTQSTDAFTTVMGPDHPSRVRLLRCGVTKTLLKQKTSDSGSSSKLDELVEKRLDKIEERIQQRINAQRDIIEREVTMNIIAQLQRLNPELTLDPNMLGFSVHSSGEALANQPINHPSVGSNNQGYLPIVLSIDVAPVPATLQLDSIPSLPFIILNSHLDSVPTELNKWTHLSFSTHMTSNGKIFARAQDDKCIGMHYLEAIKVIQNFDPNFVPLRNVHIVYVPDEEVGGFDGMKKFVELKEFEELNVGFMMDGRLQLMMSLRVFYVDLKPWHMVIKAVGMPGHGSKLYDNTAMENLMKSIKVITNFRESEFDIVKAGLVTNFEVISVNPVFLKAGTPSLTLSFRSLF
ncbi:hypothetical protein P3S68_021036 [Capsicum galapagoense]